jgi:EpsI family protein
MTAAPVSWSPLRLGLVVAAAAGVLVAEWLALEGIIYMWTNSPMYSFGWLVPAISGWLLWSRRDRLAAAVAAPTPATGLGLFTLAVWALMVVAGRVGGILLLEQLAIPVAVTGLVLVFAGRPALAASWAAIAYLLLGIPLWDAFTEPLHLRFQLLSAGFAVSMLQALDIPVHGSGTFIDLPTMRIEVARACSGVNYLVAVLALGLPLAYLHLRSWWRRGLLIASALAIAALSNSLRVAIIGILVYYDLGAPLHGPAHTLHGLFVSAIGHVALFVGLWLLGDGRALDAGRPAVSAAAARPGWLGLASATALVWLVLLWTAAAVPEPVVLASSLDRLPARLGSWAADPFATPRPPAWWPPADQQFSRRYRADGGPVDVFVGYFEQQRQAHEVMTSGAAPLHRAARPIVVNGPAGPLAVNAVHDGVGADASLVVFWYEIDGVSETRPLAVKLRTLWHALGRGRSNGAIIYLEARPAPGGPASADVEIALVDLAGRVHAALAGSLPGRAASVEDLRIGRRVASAVKP